MIEILFKIILSVLISDLMTGIVHWWEDAYGNPNWKFFGKSVIEPNLRHHKSPREFIKGSYWSRINTSFYLGLVLILLCRCFSILNIYSLISIVIATHGNEVHRFSHQTNKENGKLIVFLQRAGILQSRKHHGFHHKAPFACNYCVVTNYVNPVLQFLFFWTIMEKLVESGLGIKVVRGSVLRNEL